MQKKKEEKERKLLTTANAIFVSFELLQSNIEN